MGEKANKEYSVCQTGNPGAILFPALWLSIYGLISIPCAILFLNTKKDSAKNISAFYAVFPPLQRP
ncbi:hypothetical protein [Hominisplanchenecus murintestinalis]|uniref:hypothetical protein n=1 Tax=Hominisplanchenecus murintestinalis TaxID=2941517 RepID=UPI00203FC5EE|nr:hypothetical protein [Hominisplanchenecus murintestinalis]